jgi:catechol 2,3-dioxygenase-like lactoylglutathione lyase family enzyme
MLGIITATNHTSFTVASLDTAIPLFCGGLDFTLTSRAGRDSASIQTITGVDGADVEIAYMRRPDHTVELIEYRAPADRASGVNRPCDLGFGHLAFDVTDLEVMIEHLEPFGAEPISPPYVNKSGGPNAGVRVCYFRTVCGITIELIERKTAIPKT